MEPVAIQHLPRAACLSDDASAPLPYYIGSRARHATCGGVAWFHGHRLAVVHLLGNAVHTYEFDAATSTLKPLQNLVGLQGLAEPENLAFAPDGDLLAITNSIDCTMNLYRVDRHSHLIESTPAAAIRPTSAVSPHGVAFAPRSGILLYSTVEDPGGLRCLRVARTPDGGVATTVLWECANPHQPLKPKGVSISPDERHLAVAYGPNAHPMPAPEQIGFVAVHEFDAERGCNLTPSSMAAADIGIRCAEDINFLPDGRHLAITDQAADAATIVAFDPVGGRIGEKKLSLTNPTAQLSFPHGNAVSSDGRFFAVANYGNDTFVIYRLAL